MDVRQMRQVAAIAKWGSFVRAAEDLGIAQPTLSRSIARLEDELGLTLFERSGAGAAPTPIGSYVAERVGRIIAETSRLQREVELVNGGQIGEIRIGFGVALNHVFLPRLALALADRYPDLKQRLIADLRANLIDGVTSGELDLVILADGEDLDPLDLRRTNVMCEPIIAVCAPSHPLARCKTVSVAEFASYPGATHAVSTLFAPHLLLGLPAEAEDRSAQFKTNAFPAVRALVESGDAVSLGFEHLFLSSLGANRMVRIDLDLKRSVSLVAATTRQAAHSALLNAIISLTIELGASLSV